MCTLLGCDGGIDPNIDENRLHTTPLAEPAAAPTPGEPPMAPPTAPAAAPPTAPTPRFWPLVLPCPRLAWPQPGRRSLGTRRCRGRRRTCRPPDTSGFHREPASRSHKQTARS